MNYGLPNRNLSDAATVGTITTLSGDRRTMQLSLRVLFQGPERRGARAVRPVGTATGS